MKRLFFAYAWLLLATGAILTSVASLQVFSLFQQPGTDTAASSKPVLLAGKSSTDDASAQELNLLSGEVKGVETVIEVDDARPKIVANFLERHGSPLQPYDEYGTLFVKLADEHGFDFRLLPAIAMQESNLCKRIPEGSFNCLGFGIHERGTLGFESYQANFERAARELKKYYIDQGRTTPEQIMRKYTPSSDGSWANSVNQWMSEMKYDDRQLGRELKTTHSVLEYTSPSPTATTSGN